jgi:hypothetical protein
MIKKMSPRLWDMSKKEPKTGHEIYDCVCLFVPFRLCFTSRALWPVKRARLFLNSVPFTAVYSPSSVLIITSLGQADGRKSSRELLISRKANEAHNQHFLCGAVRLRFDSITTPIVDDLRILSPDTSRPGVLSLSLQGLPDEDRLTDFPPILSYLRTPGQLDLRTLPLPNVAGELVVNAAVITSVQVLSHLNTESFFLVIPVLAATKHSRTGHFGLGLGHARVKLSPPQKFKK